MGTNENDLVGLIIALMDRFGVTDVQFTAEEMDRVANRFMHDSLQVKIANGNICAWVGKTGISEEQTKVLSNSKTH